MRVEHFYSM